MVRVKIRRELKSDATGLGAPCGPGGGRTGTPVAGMYHGAEDWTVTIDSIAIEINALYHFFFKFGV